MRNISLGQFSGRGTNRIPLQYKPGVISVYRTVGAQCTYNAVTCIDSSNSTEIHIKTRQVYIYIYINIYIYIYVALQVSLQQSWGYTVKFLGLEEWHFGRTLAKKFLWRLALLNCYVRVYQTAFNVLNSVHRTYSRQISCQLCFAPTAHNGLS
jgi:ABC-type uncharacterized transport system permease subunit